MNTVEKTITINGIKRFLPNGRSEISDYWQEITMSGTLSKMCDESQVSDPHFFGVSLMAPTEFNYIIGVESMKITKDFFQYTTGTAEWFEFTGEGELPTAIQNKQERVWQEHGSEIAAISENRNIAINVEEYFDMTPDYSKFKILIPKTKVSISEKER